MKKKEMDFILQEGEGQFIEFKESFDKSIAQKPVQKTTQESLEAIKENHAITRSGLSAIVGVSESTIKFHIKNMKKDLFKGISLDKGRRWDVLNR